MSFEKCSRRIYRLFATTISKIKRFVWDILSKSLQLSIGLSALNASESTTNKRFSLICTMFFHHQIWAVVLPSWDFVSYNVSWFLFDFWSSFFDNIKNKLSTRNQLLCSHHIFFCSSAFCYWKQQKSFEYLKIVLRMVFRLFDRSIIFNLCQYFLLSLIVFFFVATISFASFFADLYLSNAFSVDRTMKLNMWWFI